MSNQRPYNAGQFYSQQGGDPPYDPSYTSPPASYQQPRNPNYAQVPSSPTSPRSPAPSSPPEVQPLQPISRKTSPPEANNARTPRFVSSPLNPHAPPNSLGSGGMRTRPSSGSSSSALDRNNSDNGDGHSPILPASNNGFVERDTLRGIMRGEVGGGYGPYTSLRPPNTPSDTSPIHPGAHNRFSTISSVGSVLSFASDTKYPHNVATPTSAALLTLPHFPNDPDPRASFMSSSNQDAHFGLYERLGDGPPDDDDALHMPDAVGTKEGMGKANWRGFFNVTVLVVLVCALVTLFAGYPVIYHFTRHTTTSTLRINGTGQAPVLPGLPNLIDEETPDWALTRTGFDGLDYELVFSDEFNTPGRTFFPGDDPYWEAVDLWYWATRDLEWYDPGQITTRGGNLVITLDDEPTNGLQFRSGMLQSWNKFCFTTGYIEVSLLLPGAAPVSGYWPGVWIMGNLGRPGHGATTDGTWPYTYDTCDVGTMPNQTQNGQPEAATVGGSAKYNGNLSWLSGQKLSRCTCPNQDHPGPDLNNPIGRGAPEIDVLEAQKSKIGPGAKVTQSVQMAPFNNEYQFLNSTPDVIIYDEQITILNSYKGSGVQQAVSALTTLNPLWFAEGGREFAVFGFEYWSDPNNRMDGYITWVTGNRTVFTMNAPAIQADPVVQIGDRLIAEEPMSIVLNLAMSESFQKVDLGSMTFPSELLVDYIRVYQRKGHTNIGCDPPDRPTANYINDHINAYINPNLTTWAMANYTYPRNSFKDGPC